MVQRVVEEHGVTAMHANHAVLMSVVAQRVSERTGVPYAIMPHGSALEYAVKPDKRFHAYATSAFSREKMGRFWNAIADLPRGRVPCRPAS